MTHMLLCHGGVLKSGALSKAQYMSSYWSAITHDFEHGGLNNDFLIKTAHPLAIEYNDQSPLENHHCAAAAKLLFDAQYQYIQVRCPNHTKRLLSSVALFAAVKGPLSLLVVVITSVLILTLSEKLSWHLWFASLLSRAPQSLN